MVKNFIRSFETVTQRWEKFNSQLHNIVNKISPEPQIFGKYEVVEPQKVSPVKGVPLHINTPPYIRVQESPSAPDDIQIKSKHEIEAMKLSCSLARELLNHLKNVIRIGVTTDELDYVAHEFVLQKGAYPSPLGYNGFPKSICTSVNNIIVHGIPDDRPLKNGDIISVDVTVFKNGFHGDCAETFLVGRVDADGKKLVDGARELLYAGIQCCGPRVPFYRIASEIQNRAKQLKLTVIPSVNGHGIGKWFHESPCIWHKIICDDDVNDEFVMQPGMVFTIEPAIGEGTEEAEILSDGWTLATADNSRAAQFEHTVAITNTGYEILTK